MSNDHFTVASIVSFYDETRARTDRTVQRPWSSPFSAPFRSSKEGDGGRGTLQMKLYNSAGLEFF